LVASAGCCAHCCAMVAVPSTAGCPQHTHHGLVHAPARLLYLANAGDNSTLLLLNVRGNRLDGDARGVEGCGGLVQLDISQNRFSGSLPVSMDWDELATYRAGSNCFSGRFPSKLRTTRILEHLDVSNNQLTGIIPTQVCVCALTSGVLGHAGTKRDATQLIPLRGILHIYLSRQLASTDVAWGSVHACVCALLLQAPLEVAVRWPLPTGGIHWSRHNGQRGRLRRQPQHRQARQDCMRHKGVCVASTLVVLLLCCCLSPAGDAAEQPEDVCGVQQHVLWHRCVSIRGWGLSRCGSCACGCSALCIRSQFGHTSQTYAKELHLLALDAAVPSSWVAGFSQHLP
jgi:hypothetical protein